MAMGVADILNQLAQRDVFSLVLPFLLIFAVVYGILEKVEILGKNKAVNAIIAGAVGLLALQLNIVSSFFERIFPGLGVGLAVLLIALIFFGLFQNKDEKKPDKFLYAIAIIIAAFVLLWTFSEWSFWGGYGIWFGDYFWMIIVAAIIGVVIYLIVKSKGGGIEE